jgi:hypothetical protein
MPTKLADGLRNLSSATTDLAGGIIFAYPGKVNAIKQIETRTVRVVG